MSEFANNDGDVPVLARGVKARFGAAMVLKGVDLRVRRGEILAVVGSSGGGKSVLLRTMLGLKSLEAGEIRLFDRNITAIDERERNALLRRCGVLFQNGALFSSLTVRENIEVPLRETGRLSEPLQDAIALVKIGLVGLSPDTADLYPRELSGGMQKRAAVARAIALDPELLFLDEPTSGLDPPSAAELDRLILDLSQALGLTVVMITHDLDSVYAISDRVAVLVDGRIITVAPVAEAERLDHPWIRAYFHGPRGRSGQRALGDGRERLRAGG
jgi:phospholipid/cholesterol/gamma-HCH transport system ATP-binding protein